MNFLPINRSMSSIVVIILVSWVQILVETICFSLYSCDTIYRFSSMWKHVCMVVCWPWVCIYVSMCVSIYTSQPENNEKGWNLQPEVCVCVCGGRLTQEGQSEKEAWTDQSNAEDGQLAEGPVSRRRHTKKWIGY